MLRRYFFAILLPLRERYIGIKFFPMEGMDGIFTKIQSVLFAQQVSSKVNLMVLMRIEIIPPMIIRYSLYQYQSFQRNLLPLYSKPVSRIIKLFIKFENISRKITIKCIAGEVFAYFNDIITNLRWRGINYVGDTVIEPSSR